MKCPCVVKEGTGGKVVSLNRVTQRSQTRRREFMGEEIGGFRVQSAWRREGCRLTGGLKTSHHSYKLCCLETPDLMGI